MSAANAPLFVSLRAFEAIRGSRVVFVSTRPRQLEQSCTDRPPPSPSARPAPPTPAQPATRPATTPLKGIEGHWSESLPSSDYRQAGTDLFRRRRRGPSSGRDCTRHPFEM